MRFLLMLIYFSAWIIGGIELEASGNFGPPFFAVYGAWGLGVYLLLSKRILSLNER